jgi:hypothetical protein
MRIRTVLFVAVVSFLMLSVASLSVVSADEGLVDVSTEYHPDTPTQEAEVEIVVQPVEDKVTDMVIDVGSTKETFTDKSSFSDTVQPSHSNIQVTSDNGVYRINEVNPNEKVKIEYETYLSTLSEKEVVVSKIDVRYVRNGQELEDSIQVSADISGNPWLEQREHEQNEVLNAGMKAATGLLVLLFVVGTLYIKRNYIPKSKAKEAQRVVRRAKRKSESKNVKSKLNRVEEILGGSSSEKKEKKNKKRRQVQER